MSLLTVIFELTTIFLLAKVFSLKQLAKKNDTITKQNIDLNNLLIQKEKECNFYLDNIDSLLAENQNLQNILDKKAEATSFYIQNQERIAAEDALYTANLLSSPSEFFLQKNSCMTHNESRMFYYINVALTELIPNSNERKNYYVFPQVSLYSFIKIRNLSSIAERIARRTYITKSIDFVICQCQKLTSSSGYSDYYYVPIVLIELDGKSHSSPDAYGNRAFDQQTKSDQFKNVLFEDLGIPFIRYQLSNNQIYAKDASLIKQKLKEILTK